MLPLSLLNTAKGHPMLVELKNGDTYNGRLVSCNMFMNLMLKDVICTSRDGDKFVKMEECYVHGNNIKYLRLPEEIISLVPEETRTRGTEGRGFSGRGGRGSGGRVMGRGRGGGRDGEGYHGGRGRGDGRGGRGRGGDGGGRSGGGGRGGGRGGGEGRGSGRGRGGEGRGRS